MSPQVSMRFHEFPWISGVRVLGTCKRNLALKETFTRSLLAAIIDPSMLAGWLLAAGWEDDEEKGFQGCPTRSAF